MRPRPVDTPELLDYRATVLLCVAALLLTLRSFQGHDLQFLVLTYETWPREPWRLLTSCLLHGSALHLIFNVYWTWKFGTIIEPAFGLLPTVGIFVFLGAGSSAAEWAFGGGGIGLSGIGYGLFGLLWVLHRYHPGYRGVMSDGVAKLFVAWFFICIIGTQMGILRIANVAHGAGCVFGALLGLCVSPLGLSRGTARALTVGATLLVALLSTIGRPYVNWSDERAWELSYDGYTALEEGDPARAAKYLADSVERDPTDHYAWHNLGVALGRLGRRGEAQDAFARALEEGAVPGEADEEE